MQRPLRHAGLGGDVDQRASCCEFSQPSALDVIEWILCVAKLSNDGSSDRSSVVSQPARRRSADKAREVGEWHHRWRRRVELADYLDGEFESGLASYWVDLATTLPVRNDEAVVRVMILEHGDSSAVATAVTGIEGEWPALYHLVRVDGRWLIDALEVRPDCERLPIELFDETYRSACAG